MKKLVIVADDFGTLPSINSGISFLYKNIPTLEISMVTKAKYSKEAATMVKEQSIQNIGIHMELLGLEDLGRPVTAKDYIKLFKEKTYEEIEKIASEELKAFETTIGKPPTHITSHKGIHGNFKLLNFIIAYAKEKNIPIRKPVTALNVELGNQNYAAEISLSRAKLKSTNYLFAHMLGNNLDKIKNAFITDLEKVNEGETAEIVIHPAFFDERLLNYSSLNYLRTRDIDLFTDQNFIDQIKKMGFKFCTYKQI